MRECRADRSNGNGEKYTEGFSGVVIPDWKTLAIGKRHYLAVVSEYRNRGAIIKRSRGSRSTINWTHID